MNEEFKKMVIDALRRGEDLPREWARELFPPEKREYELVYYGKDREEDIIADTMAVPLQPVSTFGKNGETWHNMLIFGDNLQAMKTLLFMKDKGQLVNADGTPGIRLIYIDPPFATKQEFRGSKDQKAYQDKIAGAMFVEFLRKRLVLLKELLSDDGSIFVHMDMRKQHYVKLVLDELFGENSFINEIIWKRTFSHGDMGQGAEHLGRLHDVILFYRKSASTKLNTVYTPYSEKYLQDFYKYSDPDGRRYRLVSLLGPGGASKGNPHYEFMGVTRYWVHSKEKMEDLRKKRLIVQTKPGAVPQKKRYLNEAPGVPLQDIWTDISPIQGGALEKFDYPTQKPEHLLERIILTGSNEDDLVFDAFAGSGTTLAVAEKLGRRWIGIDCGKLAIYTVQKRMLNLKTGIGNKGKPINPKPFTLYNAGLYDFSKLKQLPWADWRFFALQLFGCKDEPHAIGGLALDGKIKGASVLVFNHVAQPGRRIDEETIRDIHSAIVKKIGRKFFIIAPRGVFDFQQDYIDLDSVRYYALRIPYSVINELHHRDFSALQQPNDETAVNETVDAVGFDFIQPPRIEWTVSVKKRKGQLFDEACLKIKQFESRARLRGEDTRGGLETLSMLMLDLDYDGKVFDLDAVYYAHQLEADEWQAWFPTENVGENIMVVFIDIYGNEARDLISRKKLGIHAPKKKSSKPKGKARQ